VQDKIDEEINQVHICLCLVLVIISGCSQRSYSLIDDEYKA